MQALKQVFDPEKPGKFWQVYTDIWISYPEVKRLYRLISKRR